MKAFLFAKTVRSTAARCGVVIALASAGCASHGTSTVGARGPAFDSPDHAVDSLVTAVRSGSPDKVQEVLGPDADDLVRSGDAVQDKNRSARFLSRFDERHTLVAADDGSLTLCIGKSQWPFPIPLVRETNREGAWRFDTARGKDEILNRRIGQDELSAIQVCLAIVDAERDYVSRVQPKGEVPAYAGRFISDPGKQNGLYWETSPGEPDSPLGALVAAATDEGYTPGSRQPYHGYYYRILTGQGVHADGGAYDYAVGGKLVGGFAVLARPANYGVSGVMTFLADYRGAVYQADLGPKTEGRAKAIKTLDPGPEWKPLEQ